MDKKTDAWMPLWIGAYLADTQRLTRDQHGGYLLLLMAYWREGGPLADDDEELAAIVKATPKEWAQLRPRMAKFFTVADGFWTHKRVEQELAGARERSEKSSSKAQKAAQARWGSSSKNAPSNAPSIPQAVQEQCPTPSPSSSLRSEQSCAKPSGYSTDFELAWMAYPSRTGHSKAEAFKAWKARIADGEAVETILQGINRYAAYCEANHTEPRFVKHAATFFGPDRHYLNDWTVQPRQAAATGFQAGGAPRYAAAAATIYEGVNL